MTLELLTPAYFIFGSNQTVKDVSVELCYVYVSTKDPSLGPLPQWNLRYE